MSFLLKIVPAILFLSSVYIKLAAQSLSKYDIGINTGFLIYQGDLTPSTAGSFKTATMVLGLSTCRKLNRMLFVRLNLSFGKLKGDDAKYTKPVWRQERNFKFSTPLTELSANLVWKPLSSERKLSQALFAGLGYTFLHIKRDYSALNAEYFAAENLSARLNEDLVKRLPKCMPVVPVGVAVQCPLAGKLSINAETSYSLTATDYLDGFSIAANPNKKDHYYKYVIGVVYSFGDKINTVALPSNFERFKRYKCYSVTICAFNSGCRFT